MDEVTREAGRAARARSRLASGYAARGWHVLPTWGRVPIKGMEKWESAATSDPYEAEAAWHPKGDWAGCNIAIACGPSGIVVVDIDRKNGKDGFKTLEALGIELPETYTVRTPSGGIHKYFKAPRGYEVRLSASAIGSGLDIRAWGGLIVAAGSTADGKSWDLISDHELAELPDEILRLIQDKSREGKKSASPLPEIIPEGERESQLVSLAGTMRRRGASEAAILAALTAENDTRCVPPLPTEDLERIAGSVGKYEPAETPSKPSEIEVDPDLLAKVLVNLETTRVANEMMKTAQMRKIREVLGGMDRPVNVLEWVQSGPDPTEVCIWGVPEKGGVMGWAANQGVIIAGPPGTGKSTIALQVILRRVGILGGDVLGMPVQVEKEPLTYLALDRADQLRQSVRRMIPEDYDREAIERLLVTDNMPPHVDLRKPETMIGWLSDTGSKTVVFDSAKDLGFDLNDSSEGQAFNYMVQALLRSGIQVFVLHHSRKVPRGDRKPLTLNDLHGSQWVAAGAGSIIMLDGVAGPDPKKLFHVKPLTVPMSPLSLTLDPESGEVGHQDYEEGDDEDEPRKRRTNTADAILQLLSMNGDPMTNADIARDLTVGSGTVSRLTRQLHADGLLKRVGKEWALNSEEVIA